MSATFQWNGDVAKRTVRNAAALGLRDGAELIKDASNEAAPEESGNLVDSSGTDVDTQSLVASIYYDPQDAPREGKPIYAVVRHEALREGGAPKYLERPLIAQRDAALRKVAAQIERVM